MAVSGLQAQSLDGRIRYRMRAHCLLFFAGLVVALGAIAPVSRALASEDELAIGIRTGVRGFDPLKGGFYIRGGEAIAQLIHETLIWRNADGSFAPKLATRWSVSEDHTQWTFQLRRGVRFHDGNEFKAGDVAAHFSRVLDPAAKYPNRSFFRPIVAVDAQDDYTVVFKLAHPWAALLPFLSMTQVVPLIPSSAQVRAGTQHSNPVGTGPYRLQQWHRDTEFRLVRNPDYWGDRPGPEKVIFRILPEEQSRLAALRSGQLDIAELQNGQTIEQAIRIKRLKYHPFAGSGGYFLLVNQRNPLLKQPAVRAAIAHAINQPVYLQVVAQGHRQPIEHILGSDATCTDTRYRAFDLATARRLRGNTGEKPVLRLPHTSTAAGRQTAAVLQQMLQAADFDVQLVGMDYKSYVKRLRSGDFDLLPWGTRENPDMGPQLYAYNHSTAGHNPTRFADPEMDALLEKMQRAVSIEERQRLQCEVSRRMNDAAHMIWLGSWSRHTFTGPRVDGDFMHFGLVDASKVRLRQVAR